jgi:hypothetical protein
MKRKYYTETANELTVQVCLAVKVLLETPGKLNLLVRESSFIRRVIKSKHLEWA